MGVREARPVFEQASWHARVLKLLCDDPSRRGDLALLTHHAEAAGDADAVLRYAPAAAAQATASGAHPEAAAQYDRALRFGATLPPEDRAGLLERFALSCAMSTRTTDAISALRDAAELRARLGDRLREGDTLRHLSCWLWPVGQCGEAMRLGRRAIELLESVPPSREIGRASCRERV